MLVLSRKLNQRITIGRGVVIEIVRIEGGKVRIGITAPDDFEIVREEILQPEHQGWNIAQLTRPM